MNVLNKYIKNYMSVNGNYTDDQIKTMSKTVYEVYYYLASKLNFPTIEIVKSPTNSKKTINEISNRTGIDSNFISLFFRALYNGIKTGNNKPEDLYIKTSNTINKMKSDNLKEKLGLNILSDTTEKIFSVLSIGAIGFIVYNLTKKRGLNNGHA
jgi:hypothetical protein